MRTDRPVRRPIVLSLLVVMLLVISGCSGGGGGLAQQGDQAVVPGAPEGETQPPVPGVSPAAEGDAPAAPAAGAQGAATAECGDEVLVGASLPLTGKEARVGGFYREGYEAAVRQWNEQKGGIEINGEKKQIRLTVLDNTTNPTTSVQQYERLVTQDQVDFLLGSYSTLLVSADNIVAERYQIPYVNGGGAASEIYTKGNKYLFGVLSSVENLAETQMDWVSKMQDAGKLPKPGKVALVWENTDHGKDYQTGVQNYAENNPDRAEVVVDESFELGGQDFTSLLRNVKTADADFFMADAHLEDFILMHRQYLEQGLYHEVVTYGARGSEKDAKEQLGTDAVAGVISATWWSPELPYPEVKEFVSYWEETHDGSTPAWYHALSYEAANTLFNAIQQAGTCDREQVRETLAQYDEKSILPGNRTYFTETGQIDSPFVIVQNDMEGNSVLIYPEDVATGDPIVPMPE
jgi:branched-chain amino acid transport system substrate-binding protein